VPSGLHAGTCHAFIVSVSFPDLLLVGSGHPKKRAEE